MSVATLHSIQVGRIAPLGDQRVPSGFVKSPVNGSIEVGPLGLTGDEQADLTVHGGSEKAVYAYPLVHYRAWAEEYPHRAALFVPGGVGENLTIAGWTEAEVCVGDVHAIGDTRLQVCQPRQPCFKFALRFGDNRLPKAMVRNGRAGWYYRVLQPGTIRAGDPILLADRPNPQFEFERLVQIVNFHDASADEYKMMSEMPGLATNLRNRATAQITLG